MPQRRHAQTSTGKRRKYRRSRSRFSPPNKGARCVALQRVYSRVLRRHVTRCQKYAGGRVGIRKRPLPGPSSRRCERRRRVYSPFLRKKVLRCAKYRQPMMPVMSPVAPGMPVSAPLPAWVEPSVVTAPIVMVTSPEPAPARYLLPPNAKSLQNKKRMYRRLQTQMRRLQASRQMPEPTIMRWPQDRPRKR
jgi:hypothetical protein